MYSMKVDVTIHTPDSDHEESFIIIANDGVDYETELTEQVVCWCSDNGYSYDECDYEVLEDYGYIEVSTF